MKRLVTTCQEKTFRAQDAVLCRNKFYACTGAHGEVCVFMAVEYGSGCVVPVVLEGLSIFNSYCWEPMPIENALQSVARKCPVWGDVYEFENLIEFLEWALEQEKKR